MKQQQEAERLAREEKKKAEEEAAKREKQKKLELEKQKREQERLRKEEEKRHREEERLKKEEEKRRRAKEEKERTAEREKKRKEKEEKERHEKEKAQKAQAEKERLEKKAKEEKERLERKAKEEKERIEKARSEKENAAADAKTKAKTASPIISTKQEEPIASKIPSPPPGINALANDANENRQQVLIEALVGSSTVAPVARPNFMEQTAAPMRPPRHLHPQAPFMASHLDILQGNSPSILSNPSSINNHSPPNLSDNSPSMMGLFHNRVTSPQEPSTSSRRSIAPIAPIGQPLSGRRQSSVPLGTSPVSSSTTDPIIMASQAVKRPSMTSPFDSTTEPRSFFSSFLFGEPKNNNMMANNDYDLRAQASSLPPQFTDRRFSTDIGSLPPQPQNSWTNGWAANSVLSDHVHGKLFGDVLVKI